MICNKDTKNEVELTNGYYWARLKSRNEHEIVLMHGSFVKTYQGNNFSVDDVEHIHSIKLDYTNELIIDFVTNNSILIDLKYGKMRGHIRHVLEGDKLVLKLDGFNPAVGLKSTDELERLNSLCLVQKNKLDDYVEEVAMYDRTTNRYKKYLYYSLFLNLIMGSGLLAGLMYSII